jgi:hypothetical protein
MAHRARIDQENRRLQIRPLVLGIALLIIAAAAMPAAAQNGSAPAPPAQEDDPDRDPNSSQPDFYVATLNSNLPLPKGAFNFRLTHRFTTTLGQGDISDLFERFFGLDGGAIIGLDLKYGLFRNFNVGVYRTSDRTIQFSGQYNLIRDSAGPLGVSVIANVDGTDNFTDEYSPGIGAVLSRELGDRGALYFQPSYIGNANITDDIGDDYTVLAGMGARVRMGRNSYLFVEGSPRVAGYAPGVGLISFGFEQRYGGHVFQLNFSNGFATTLAQVARGGTANDDWYLGFNLARKFF